MYRYLLDADVFIPFQRSGFLNVLGQAAQVVPMAIVDDVRDELILPKGPTDPLLLKKQEAAQVIHSSIMDIVMIAAGSNEESIRNSLRGIIGKGEAASIAVAMQRPELIFVTEDNKAVHGQAKLYRQLPGDVGRIIGLHVFLRILVEKGALSVTQSKRVVDARPIDSPLWWSAWLSMAQAAS